MLNEETTKYILSNIDKIDFISIEFLKTLREIIIDSNIDYKYSFRTYEINNSKNGYPYYKNGLVSINKPFIEKDCYMILSKYNIEKTLVTKNLLSLVTILHEITHAYNFYLTLTKDSTLVTMLIDSSKAIEGCYKTKGFLRTGHKFYNEYHDIFPEEVHAENISSMYSLNIYNALKEEYKTNIPFYKYLMLSNIISPYRLKLNTLLPPTKSFYNKINLIDKYNSLDKSNLSNLELLLYGLLEDKNTFNKVINNEILLTSNVNYLNRLKKTLK